MLDPRAWFRLVRPRRREEIWDTGGDPPPAPSKFSEFGGSVPKRRLGILAGIRRGALSSRGVEPLCRAGAAGGGDSGAALSPVRFDDFGQSQGDSSQRRNDPAFDESLGGTILSTEDVFAFLAEQFPVSRILLAGIEAGVWEDFPARNRLLKEIQLSRYDEALKGGIKGSVSADVTGGMKAKVEEMFALIQKNAGLTAQIFSAEEPGALARALRGENVGTLLTP
ncbi:hypothetical protein FBQ83_03260 [Chloroflexi bacterium CFX5]|nr:hypothetical protein [Chloroflexi bacterium CFX5]